MSSSSALTVTTAAVTVIGIGNPIMSDDGTGLAILRVLQARAAGADPQLALSETAWVPHRPVAGPIDDAAPLRAGVDFVDGGTSGMELLPIIQSAQRVLLLDAVASPRPAGSVIVLRGDQVPRLLTQQLSPHQVGLLDLLAAARLLGREPQEIAVVGVVPETTELEVGLTPTVAAAIPAAADAAEEIIADWLGE